MSGDRVGRNTSAGAAAIAEELEGAVAAEVVAMVLAEAGCDADLSLLDPAAAPGKGAEAVGAASDGAMPAAAAEVAAVAAWPAAFVPFSDAAAESLFF